MNTADDWTNNDLFAEIFFYVRRVEKQSPLQRDFEMVHDFIMEVANGGFLQYFTESTRTDSPHIVQALKSFGADDVAELLERSLNLMFPTGFVSSEELETSIALPWLQSTKIRSQILEIEEEYNLIATQFWKRLFYSLKSHPEEFPIDKILARMESEVC